MRAHVCARIFCKVYSDALAECIVGTNKRRAATRTRLLFIYHLVIYHGFIYLTNLTMSVLSAGTWMSLRLRSTFSPVSGLIPAALYLPKISA